MINGAMYPPKILLKPSAKKYQDEFRTWQGIPSIERTAGGRLYVNFYTGMETETSGNFMVVITSDDNGETWNPTQIVVEHEDEEIRVYDPCIWVDPMKRLWLTWNQSRGFFDGRMGVWVSICENPDDAIENTVWSTPRRIANGVMMNKPIVRNNGEWLFPCAIWKCQEPSEEHNLDNEKFSNVYSSADNGETFMLKGSADIADTSWNEHMVVEKMDGSLWMLARCFYGIGESFSYDGGKTWTEGRKSHIDGPCSRFHIRRLKSGRLLMINHYGFNETNDIDDLEKQGNVKVWKGRTNLSALLSEDDGVTWPYHLLLDERKDAAYPDAVEGEDGYLYVVYDYERFTEREILIARFTEEDVIAGAIKSPGSVLKKVINKALALPV